jgi:hypothetical protein
MSASFHIARTFFLYDINPSACSRCRLLPLTARLLWLYSLDLRIALLLPSDSRRSLLSTHGCPALLTTRSATGLCASLSATAQRQPRRSSTILPRFRIALVCSSPSIPPPLRLLPPHLPWLLPCSGVRMRIAKRGMRLRIRSRMRLAHGLAPLQRGHVDARSFHAALLAVLVSPQAAHADVAVSHHREVARAAVLALAFCCATAAAAAACAILLLSCCCCIRGLQSAAGGLLSV